MEYPFPPSPPGYTSVLIARVLLAAWDVIGVGILIVSGVRSVPHSLSYVNSFGGGMAEGHQWFADCNFDWGQDLPALHRWAQRHPDARPLSVGYFGVVPPNVAGVEFESLPDELLSPTLGDEQFHIPPGWYAISVSHVHGVEGVTYASTGQLRTVFDGRLTVFESRVPIDRAGPSILIYRIGETQSSESVPSESKAASPSE